MTAISQRIPNLLGGVSQQPDSLKLPGQMRGAYNCNPDPTYGMNKRPGLKLVSALTGATNSGRWFSIFRDDNEAYIGQFLTDGTMLVWDAFTGQPQTVNAIAASAKAYIANCSRSDFEMLQINDYNFVLNRSKVVATLSTTSPAQVPTAVVTVNLLGYDSKYTVNIDGSAYSYNTPATGTLDLKATVEGIANAIPGATYDKTVAGNTIVISKKDSSDFTITAEGGNSAQALLAYKESVPNVSRLPSQCKNGVKLKVSNLEEASEDDYYVEFKTTTGTTGAGVWEECLKPGIKTSLDPDTMPHVVIRESNGTFTFRSLNEAQKAGEDLYWVERRVGDDDTNPFPSFVGKTITGISFFRNRLVLLAGSNVICSQPGSYFNLSRLSALTQTDADGIDLATGSTRPVALRHALGDQTGLLVFSSDYQYLLDSDQDNFGPVSARIKQFSSYSVNTLVRPVETGLSYVFVDKNAGSSQVTEMVAASADNRPSVAELTRTAPNFVPADLRSLACSSSAGLITFLGNADPSKLKVFKFFNNSGERVLASWVEWQLPGDCLFQSIDSDTLYLVTEQENGVCLSRVSLITDVEGTALNQSGISYEYRLDLFKKNPTSAYDAVNDVTKIYFEPNTYDSTQEAIVVVDDSSTERGSIYIAPPVGTDGGGTYVTVPGDRTGAFQITLGYSYDYRLELPTFFVKRPTGESRVQSDVSNIPRITRLVIQSNDSGPYSADVQVLGRAPSSFTFEQVNANAYLANTSPLPSLVDNIVPVYGKGTDSLVTLHSRTPFPLSLVAATWYGIYSTRGIRQA